MVQSPFSNGFQLGVPAGAPGPAPQEEAFSESAMHRRILKVCFLNTIQRRHTPWPLPLLSGAEFLAVALQYGYGSIPINTIFRGMNIHLPAILMFTRGTRFWHTAICWIMVIVFFCGTHSSQVFLRYREGMKDAYVFVGQVETKNRKGFRFQFYITYGGFLKYWYPHIIPN